MDNKTEADLPKKYKRRTVKSNWQRYVELPLEDEIIDGEDYMLGEDFSKVLKLHGRAANETYFHLKNEVAWEIKKNANALGALNVSELVTSLATIPFHEQLKLPNESLPAHDKNIYNEIAEEHKKSMIVDEKSNFTSKLDYNDHVDIDINESSCKFDHDSSSLNELILNNIASGQTNIISNKEFNFFKYPKNQDDKDLTNNYRELKNDCKSRLNSNISEISISNKPSTVLSDNSSCEQVKKLEKDNSDQSETIPKDETKNLEDWLDSILD